MKKKKLAVRVISLAFFIFILNYLAMALHWYSSIWWFDMPVHFLGGVFVGLLLFRLFSFQNISKRNIFDIFLGVFLIGLAWEMFEILIFNYLEGSPFIFLDTLSDIFFDLAGAGAAILYFSKRIISEQKNTL